jgi:hypothetical protein
METHARVEGSGNVPRVISVDSRKVSKDEKARVELLVDEFHNEDAAKFVAGMKAPVDLTLMIDLVEHLEKEAALKLIDSLRRRTRFLLVTFPRGRRMHKTSAEDTEVGRVDFPEGLDPEDRRRSEWWLQDQALDGWDIVAHHLGSGSPNGVWTGLYRAQEQASLIG